MLTLNGKSEKQVNLGNKVHQIYVYISLHAQYAHFYTFHGAIVSIDAFKLLNVAQCLTTVTDTKFGIGFYDGNS